ncbi:MAG: ABC transporter permease, partial [Chloroflexi bacterium]
MTQSAATFDSAVAESPVAGNASTLARVGKYTLVRGVTLFITVIIGVYLTVLIANMGGYVDNIRRGEIREFVSMQVMNDPGLSNLPGEEKRKLIEERVRLAEKRLGLDQPFLLRSVRFLRSR